MSGLSISHLSFAYGTRSILVDACLTLPRAGQLTVLIGPNASGKSTLFRLIAGLLKPRAGRITLYGEDLAMLTTQARLKKICFMPQYFAASAALTVFDVVMMAQKHLHGWRVTQTDMEIVGSALDRAGIGYLSEAYVSELSGGQSQMVSIVQALIRNSNVYLFDEPTSALDLHHQLDILARIKSAMQQRNTIGIVALHDLNLAARFADHVMLLGNGEIQVEGPPDDVLRSSMISDIYGVDIEIALGPRMELAVHAYPS